MSYQEKRILASVISGVGILVGYCVYGVIQYQKVGVSILSNLKYWASLMLITIGLGIAVMMVIQIFLHIFLAVTHEVKKEISKEIAKRTDCGKGLAACEELEMDGKEDEMDKLIALKASKYSFAVVGVGFLAALISLYFQLPPGVMLNILFISLMKSCLLEGILQLRFYQQGIYHA